MYVKLIALYIRQLTSLGGKSRRLFDRPWEFGGSVAVKARDHLLQVEIVTIDYNSGRRCGSTS
jgi:hypothetical protein